MPVVRLRKCVKFSRHPDHTRRSLNSIIGKSTHRPPLTESPVVSRLQTGQGSQYNHPPNTAPEHANVSAKPSTPRMIVEPPFCNKPNCFEAVDL